jgi:hypothetical protein
MCYENLRPTVLCVRNSLVTCEVYNTNVKITHYIRLEEFVENLHGGRITGLDILHVKDVYAWRLAARYV